MFVIIWGKKYSSHYSDVIDRDFVCEECSHKFRIRFFHSGKGISASAMGVGDDRARQDAVLRAKASFDQTVDSALPHYPCPSCNWYQSSMNAYFKKYKLSKTIIGLSVALLAVLYLNLTDAVTTIRHGGIQALLHDESWIYFIFPIISILTFALGIALLLKFRANLNRSAPKPTAWLAENQPGA